MGFFDQAKMLAEARRIQKQLRSIIIEVEKADGKLKLSLNGEQKIQSIEIDPSLLGPENKDYLERLLKEALDEAITKSQREAAFKMKDIAGGLGL